MRFVWFPPRLVQIDESVLDVNDMIDGSVERYLAEAISLPTDESHIKDAQKVIEFCKQFPNLLPEQ